MAVSGFMDSEFDPFSFAHAYLETKVADNSFFAFSTLLLLFNNRKDFQREEQSLHCP